MPTSSLELAGPREHCLTVCFCCFLSLRIQHVIQEVCWVLDTASRVTIKTWVLKENMQAKVASN
eukprot:5939389-Amphidinium_carterae.1